VSFQAISISQALFSQPLPKEKHRILQSAARASKKPSEPQGDGDNNVGLAFDDIAHHVS